MMTKGEWEEAVGMRDIYSASASVAEAGILVGELFASLDAPGMVRLRDHARAVGEQLPTQNLRDLIDNLKELLPPPRAQCCMRPKKTR